jgi:hypothetical protein
MLKSCAITYLVSMIDLYQLLEIETVVETNKKISFSIQSVAPSPWSKPKKNYENPSHIKGGKAQVSWN